MAETVLQLTTGQGGSGKSWSRIRWLANDFLVNAGGIYITNIPIFPEKIARYVSDKYSSKHEHCSYEAVLERLVVIPVELWTFWRSIHEMTGKEKKQYLVEGAFPPVEYLRGFADRLSNAHIALDEFHTIYPKTRNSEFRRLWGDYFSEIRKDGCTFEAITQNVKKLASEYADICGKHVDLMPFGGTRDPFFRIPMYDWYQLRAGFTGSNEQRIVETEYLMMSGAMGRNAWKLNNQRQFTITPDIYPLYDSYSKTDGSKGGLEEPWQRYGKKIVYWFMRRHWFAVSWRFILFVFFAWLCFGGGMLTSIQLFTKALTEMSKANLGKNQSFNHHSAVPVSPAVSRSVSLPPSALPVNGGNLPPGVSAAGLPPVETDRDREKKEFDKAGFQPAMFFDGQIFLRNGLKIYKDYEFKGGIYDGLQVTEINESERYYVLDDDTIVSMFSHVDRVQPDQTVASGRSASKTVQPGGAN